MNAMLGERPLEVLKVDLTFDSPGPQDTTTPEVRKAWTAGLLQIAGHIGERTVAMHAPRIPLIFKRTTTGTFGPLHLKASFVRSHIDASIGLDTAELTLSREGSLQTLRGRRSGDAVAFEFVERYRGPFDIRHVGSLGYVDLELRASAPFTLTGECERAIDALLVAMAVPTVLRSSAGFGAGATPATWMTGGAR